MSSLKSIAHPGIAVNQTDEARVYAKVTWRLIPLLFMCYVVAYLDRVNVGFAKLQMLHDLALARESSSSAISFLRFLATSSFTRWARESGLHGS
jgi:sugar phosphate permease